METYSALLALCEGNSPVTGEFPSQRQVTRSFEVFFDLSLKKRLCNRDTDDLRHHRAHYDVTVMVYPTFHPTWNMDQAQRNTDKYGAILCMPIPFTWGHNRLLWRVSNEQPGSTTNICGTNSSKLVVPINPTFIWLTHWGRDKMDAVSQTIFSNAFSWMKIYAFRLKFHWGLFLRVKLTIFQHWFR